MRYVLTIFLTFRICIESDKNHPHLSSLLVWLKSPQVFDNTRLLPMLELRILCIKYVVPDVRNSVTTFHRIKCVHKMSNLFLSRNVHFILRCP